MAASPPLPPELLLKILSHSISSIPTLLSASLVSRSWRHPAQLLLERLIALPSQRTARTWLAGCPGRVTKRRELVVPAGLSKGEYGEVWESVEGVKEVRVLQEQGKMREGFDVRALESDNLSSLSTLRLSAPLLDSSPSHPLVLASPLTSLSLAGLYRAFPPSILCTLLASSPSSITSLDLDCYGPPSLSTPFLSSLTPLSASLKAFHLRGSDRATPALLAFLSTCTTLTSFSCWEATHALLSALPPSVEYLSIGRNYVANSEPSYFFTLVESGLLSRGLKTLRFGGISSATLKAQVGGEDLLAVCEERGVEVSFGVEASGRFGTYGFPCLGGRK